MKFYLALLTLSLGATTARVHGGAGCPTVQTALDTGFFVPECGTDKFKVTITCRKAKLVEIEMDYIGDIPDLGEMEDACGVLSDKTNCTKLGGSFETCDDIVNECEIGGSWWVGCRAP